MGCTTVEMDNLVKKLAHTCLKNKFSTSSSSQVEVYANMQVQTSNSLQTTWVLLDSEATVNFVSQMFLVRHSYSDISSLNRIWFVNNEIIYYYEIVNLDYSVSNFKESLKFRNMSFHSVNMTDYKMILNILWLRNHNFNMNWKTSLWQYYLQDN